MVIKGTNVVSKLVTKAIAERQRERAKGREGSSTHRLTQKVNVIVAWFCSCLQICCLSLEQIYEISPYPLLNMEDGLELMIAKIRSQ